MHPYHYVRQIGNRTYHTYVYGNVTYNFSVPYYSNHTRHHLRRATVPYCGPVGTTFSYRPMFVPPGVALKVLPPRMAPFRHNETRWLPVMRVEDGHPIHFFYYAHGCSDMYIRAHSSRVLIAHDRLEALRLMHRNEMSAGKMLAEHCEHQIERYAFTYLTRALASSIRMLEPSTLRAAISGSGCLNNHIHTLMHSKRVQTLVLNYEVPGSGFDASDVRRKIEIIHLGELYGPNHTLCEPESMHGCLYCPNSTLSLATCTRTLGAVLGNQTVP